jgi:hypothetical protein
MMRLPDVLWKDPARADGERLLAAWAAAETRREEAAAHLRREEEAMLVAGLPLDEDRFHHLVCQYLHAQRAALGARRAWQQWQADHAAGGAPPDQSHQTAPPPPRLQFARWLYLHGRIAG